MQQSATNNYGKYFILLLVENKYPWARPALLVIKINYSIDIKLLAHTFDNRTFPVQGCFMILK